MHYKSYMYHKRCESVFILKLYIKKKKKTFVLYEFVCLLINETKPKPAFQYYV